LECSDGRGLESQVCLEILGNLTNETLEGELSDQELSRLLVTTNFTESDGSWSLILLRLFNTCIYEASSLHQLLVQIYGQPWLPIAFVGPFLR
jgi:hypothetical protein